MSFHTSNIFVFQVNSDFLSNALFECACDEKLDVLPAYIQIEKVHFYLSVSY